MVVNAYDPSPGGYRRIRSSRSSSREFEALAKVGRTENTTVAEYLPSKLETQDLIPNTDKGGKEGRGEKKEEIR